MVTMKSPISLWIDPVPTGLNRGTGFLDFASQRRYGRLRLESALWGTDRLRLRAMSKKTANDPEAVTARLHARRDELRHLAAAHSADRAPVELDQARVGRLSRMDALQSQAMSIETERRRQVELQQIEAALKRLDKGDYGYCLNCGEEIAPKRLEFNPTAAVCIDCARGSG